MKCYIFLIILIVSFSKSELFCKPTGTLRGTVTDSLKGEYLPYVNVFLDSLNYGAMTDVNGNFIIRGIPANKFYSVRISHIGFVSQILKVYISEEKITQIEVLLSPYSVLLDEIEALGKRNKRENIIGKERLTIKELDLLPKSVEADIIRSLQFIPGVQTSGDISARYYVRGGSSDQNLVLYNGVTLYNPFHAMGLFSVIDPDAINAIEFYKGSYPAEYGDRLSSILNVISKDGNKNKFGGSASLSFLSGKVLLEGPLPFGSFIITGRRSLFDNVLKKFLNYKDIPFEFHDFSFKANYGSVGNEKITRISLFGFNSQDKLKSGNNLSEDFNWRNNIIGARWFQAWTSPLYSETIISLSNYKAEVFPQNSNSLHRFNSIDDISIRMDFNYMYESNDELKVGYVVKSIDTKLQFDNIKGYVTHLSDFGANISIYGKYRLLRFDNLMIDAGSRFCLASIADKNNTKLEPRVSTLYNLSEDITLKAAWGIYSQDMATFSDENEIISLFETWFIIPGYISTPSAIQYSTGTDLNISNKIALNVECYYKIFHNLSELNQKKVFPDDKDLLNGKGESYGWEFELKAGFGRMQINSGYSLSWAYKQIEGKTYYPRYDSRHVFNINLSYEFSNDILFSVLWSYSSGHPFTPIKGYYDKLYFDDPFSPWYIYESYSPYIVMGSKNIRRLPEYHRLDLSLSKRISLSFIKLDLSVNAINVYNRKNIFYFERETGKRVDMLPFLLTGTCKIEI